MGARRLFPINTAIEPLNQLRSPHGEGVTYAKESRKGDGSAGLYLLPVASGEANPIMSSCVNPLDLRSFFTRSPKARKNCFSSTKPVF